jgi:hypothetical protein
MTRRYLLILVAAALALSAFSLSGCGKKTKTVYTPGGKATVTEKGAGKGKTTKVEIETKEGKVTTEHTERMPTEKDLGVPVYPGSKVESSGSWSYSGKDDSGKYSGAMLVTNDSVDKVSAFYKSKLPAANVAFEGQIGGVKQAQIGVGQEGTQQYVWISITEDKDTGKTMIAISRGQKGG